MFVRLFVFVGRISSRLTRYHVLALWNRHWRRWKLTTFCCSVIPCVSPKRLRTLRVDRHEIGRIWTIIWVLGFLFHSFIGDNLYSFPPVLLLLKKNDYTRSLLWNLTIGFLVFVNRLPVHTLFQRHYFFLITYARLYLAKKTTSYSYAVVSLSSDERWNEAFQKRQPLSLVRLPRPCAAVKEGGRIWTNSHSPIKKSILRELGLQFELLVSLNFIGSHQGNL